MFSSTLCVPYASYIETVVYMFSSTLCIPYASYMETMLYCIHTICILYEVQAIDMFSSIFCIPYASYMETTLQECRQASYMESMMQVYYQTCQHDPSLEIDRNHKIAGRKYQSHGASNETMMSARGPRNNETSSLTVSSKAAKCIFRATSYSGDGFIPYRRPC